LQSDRTSIKSSVFIGYLRATLFDRPAGGKTGKKRFSLRDGHDNLEPRDVAPAIPHRDQIIVSSERSAV